MKLYELGKEYGLNSVEALQEAKNAGFGYTGFGSNVKDEDIGQLRATFDEVAKKLAITPKEVKVSLPQEMKKGAFIGIVCNGDKYQLVSLRLTSDEIDGRYDSQVLYESNTVFGAMLELNKKITKVINPNTVKEFKNGTK